MNLRRPPAVTAVCFIASVTAIFGMVTCFADFSQIGTTETLHDHPIAANMRLTLHLLDPGISLLTCYFMLRARAWARWLYVLWSWLLYAIAFVFLALPHPPAGFEFLEFTGGMVPGVLFIIFATIVLFRSESRDYFAEGGRPWWQRERKA